MNEAKPYTAEELDAERFISRGRAFAGVKPDRDARWLATLDALHAVETAARAERKAHDWWFMLEHTESPTDQDQVNKAHEDWCYAQNQLAQALAALDAGGKGGA